jgi:hypothetical protein
MRVSTGCVVSLFMVCSIARYVPSLKKVHSAAFYCRGPQTDRDSLSRYGVRCPRSSVPLVGVDEWRSDEQISG